jgi:hypothetical protein
MTSDPCTTINHIEFLVGVSFPHESHSNECVRAGVRGKPHDRQGQTVWEMKQAGPFWLLSLLEERVECFHVLWGFSRARSASPPALCILRLLSLSPMGEVPSSLLRIFPCERSRIWRQGGWWLISKAIESCAQNIYTLRSTRFKNSLDAYQILFLGEKEGDKALAL